MIRRSRKPTNIYKNIDKIGIYNPCFNKVYIYKVSDLPKETIEYIEKEIICYWFKGISKWDLKDYKLCPDDIDKIWEIINKKNSH